MDLVLEWGFGIWDILLVIVVTAQAVVLARVRDARHKALILTLPFPFTVAIFAVGKPVDASNVVGLLLLFLFVQGVRLQVQRIGVPIVPAIGIAIVGYVTLSRFLLGNLPQGAWFFWGSCAALFCLGLSSHRYLQAKSEPAHRCPLSLGLKIALLLPMVSGLLLCKQMMQGFLTLFPMLSIIGLYECRYSLSTVGRQMPVVLACMVAMLAVCRLTQESSGMGGALVLGWGAFLVVLIAFLALQKDLKPVRHGRPGILDGA